MRHAIRTNEFKIMLQECSCRELVSVYLKTIPKSEKNELASASVVYIFSDLGDGADMIFLLKTTN